MSLTVLKKMNGRDFRVTYKGLAVTHAMTRSSRGQGRELCS